MPMKAFETYNAQFIEDQYARWRTEPQSVSTDWQHFFKGFDLAEVPAERKAPGTKTHAQQARVEALTYRYRDIGHLLSCMDPLVACPVGAPPAGA